MASKYSASWNYFFLQLLFLITFAFFIRTVYTFFPRYAHSAKPIFIIFGSHKYAHANPKNKIKNRFKATTDLYNFFPFNTHQWYQASHPSQPIIGEPSSTLPQAGQIQTRLPSASFIMDNNKNVIKGFFYISNNEHSYDVGGRSTGFCYERQGTLSICCGAFSAGISIMRSTAGRRCDVVLFSSLQ